MARVIDLFSLLYTSRVYDSLLPFFLFFTLFYAFLLRVKLFKQRNVTVVVSLILALIPVILHVQGVYDQWGLPDIIVVINASLPGVMLWALAIVMLFILLAPAGLSFKLKEDNLGYTIGLILFIMSILVVGIIFAGNLGYIPPDVIGTLFAHSETLQLVLFIAALAWLIFWLITPPKPRKKPEKPGKSQMKAIDEIAKRVAKELITGVEEKK